LPAYAAIQTRVVEYQAGETRLVGFLAYDDKYKDKRPGVLIVHEWWGHNDFVRERARQLATLGYVAFALDMYGDAKTANNPQDAGHLAGAVRSDLQVLRMRFNAALAQLKSDSHTDPGRVAAIGYSFGGAVVLEMARSGADINAVVSFHGGLVSNHPAEKGGVKARVLVLHGANDAFVKPGQISQFKQEMAAAGANYEFVTYPGAKHGFTNPAATSLGKKFSLALQYSPSADKASWEKVQGFLKDVFK
jgi:dienelactone hydrolase